MSDKKSEKNSVDIERLKTYIDKYDARQDLANIMGCDVSLITKHHNGDRAVTLDFLVKYAAAFGCSTDYLLGLAQEPTTDKDMRYICDFTGLSEQAVSFIHNLSLKKDGYISLPVENDKTIIGKISSKEDMPIFTLNYLINNQWVLGLIHTYLTITNEKEGNIYMGDRASTLLFEIMYKLREMRNELQKEDRNNE